MKPTNSVVVTTALTLPTRVGGSSTTRVFNASMRRVSAKPLTNTHTTITGRDGIVVAPSVAASRSSAFTRIAPPRGRVPRRLDATAVITEPATHVIGTAVARAAGAPRTRSRYAIRKAEKGCCHG